MKLRSVEDCLEFIRGKELTFSEFRVVWKRFELLFNSLHNEHHEVFESYRRLKTYEERKSSFESSFAKMDELAVRMNEIRHIMKAMERYMLEKLPEWYESSLK